MMRKKRWMTIVMVGLLLTWGAAPDSHAQSKALAPAVAFGALNQGNPGSVTGGNLSPTVGQTDLSKFTIPEAQNERFVLSYDVCETFAADYQGIRLGVLQKVYSGYAAYVKEYKKLSGDYFKLLAAYKATSPFGPPKDPGKCLTREEWMAKTLSAGALKATQAILGDTFKPPSAYAPMELEFGLIPNPIKPVDLTQVQSQLDFYSNLGAAYPRKTLHIAK